MKSIEFIVAISEYSRLHPAQIGIIIMKKTLLPLFVLLVSLAIFASCTPLTKDSYMEKYDELYNEVSNSHETYTDEDWNDIEEKMNLYSGEYYDKFESELTSEDKRKIQSYEIKLAFYKELHDVKVAYDSLRKDVDGAIEIVEDEIDAAVEYMENDFVDDMEEIGRETGELFKDIWSDFEDYIEE